MVLEDFWSEITSSRMFFGPWSEKFFLELIKNLSQDFLHQGGSIFVVQGTSKLIFGGKKYPTACSSKNRHFVENGHKASPILILAFFGVREPQNKQKTSKWAVVFENRNFMRLKYIFHPISRLKGAIGSYFQALFDRKIGKIWFIDQNSKTLKWYLNASNWLKNTFFELYRLCR